MLETNSGVRGSGGSFCGKSQASSSNTKEVEADEASFGLNSQTTEGVQGLKDKDSRAAVDGVNPASGNMLQQEKQKSCALGTVVENESKKRAHVKQLKMPFVGLIRIICINKTTKMMILMDVHQKEGVVDGLVVTIMSVLWSPKLEVKGLEEANGQGGSSSGKQCCNMRHYEDNTDNLRDFVCTSRIIDFSYTEDSDICGSVDVVNVTPPKDRNQQNHDDDFVDRRFTKSSSETVRCALTFATRNADVGNVVLVTPPQ
ncbi:BnaA09g17500D [Brassica napus]|uniref:BnaA09g17500D protein n=1 Tax=Brassica napus TaxID=3708 RepID=A0A078FJC7_BRANA|nr:BnaA09g17500D [Brassica napus]